MAELEDAGGRPMKLTQSSAEIYVPDGLAPEEALARTSHLGVCAHPDDLEIMAYDGILRCFQQEDRWFSGVVVTDGAGSPRDDLYRDYTDPMMREVRRKEEKKAAFVGEYAAVALLDYPSSAVKTPADTRPKLDLAAILLATRPETVYTHNLADKHDTHVAVALRTIAAIHSLREDLRPKHLYGVEVWRDLDWMTDADKVAFDLSAHENLQAALVGIFDSQICGGKRYDLATLGRRRAQATYHASHGTDVATSLGYAMDLSPLITVSGLSPSTYVAEFFKRFAGEVQGRLAKLEGQAA
jgi:LmbE family N-acetylglucosaminyl deacetylase